MPDTPLPEFFSCFLKNASLCGFKQERTHPVRAVCLFKHDRRFDSVTQGTVHLIAENVERAFTYLVKG